MPPPPSLQILHAYRHLYRAALAATFHSQPARYTIRNRIRTAFRSQTSQTSQTQTQTFDPSRVHRTLSFLRSAAASPGLERRVIRNLVRTWGERERNGVMQPRGRVLKDNVAFHDLAWEEFERCVAGLERSLGVGFG